MQKTLKQNISDLKMTYSAIIRGIKNMETGEEDTDEYDRLFAMSEEFKMNVLNLPTITSQWDLRVGDPEYLDLPKEMVTQSCDICESLIPPENMLGMLDYGQYNHSEASGFYQCANCPNIGPFEMVLDCYYDDFNTMKMVVTIYDEDGQAWDITFSKDKPWVAFIRSIFNLPTTILRKLGLMK